MPILVGDISGVYVDPRDGRTAVAIRAIANVEGPSQSNPGRSPVSYAASDLVAELRIGEWTSVAESSLKDAISERAAWDAAYPRP